MTHHTPTRSTGERLTAWLYTGPFGHLYAMTADLTELWVRWALLRGREALAAKLGRSS